MGTKELKDNGNIKRLYLGGSLDVVAVAKLQDALCFFVDPQEQSLVLDFSWIKHKYIVYICSLQDNETIRQFNISISVLRVIRTLECVECELFSFSTVSSLLEQLAWSLCSIDWFSSGHLENSSAMK